MGVTNFVTKIYGEIPEEGKEILQSVVEITGESLPFIRGVMNWYKFRKIDEELNNHSEQITTLKNKLEASENELFIKQEIFPIILQNILNEEQPQKISVMLNGFEHIIDEDILETEKIFYFYDVLSELRLSDIVYLIDEYVETWDLETKIPKKSGMKFKDVEELLEFKGYMDNKLLRIGILKYKKERVYQDYYANDYNATGLRKDYEFDMEKFRLSSFGHRFVEFFKGNN